MPPARTRPPTSTEVPTQPSNGDAVRQEYTKRDIEKLQDDLEALEKKVQEQAETIATLRERLSIFSMVGAALTLIVGAVSAYIGAVIK